MRSIEGERLLQMVTASREVSQRIQDTSQPKVRPHERRWVLRLLGQSKACLRQLSCGAELTLIQIKLAESYLDVEEPHRVPP
jgi:hypothetical protein